MKPDDGATWFDLYLFAAAGCLINYGGWVYYWKGFQAPGMAVLILGVVVLSLFWSGIPEPE